uniref:Uncharacterized protein n=1 Tax=Corydalis conspersa TaxID=2182691 RepID=A0A6G8J3G9_9MAGN|nr:hypothetical protein [Corydalis conspersa]QIM61597.1 hypothetical protein [Corydalis conspersa]
MRTHFLYALLNFLVENENSVFTIFSKLEQLLRRDGESRLQLKREALDRLPQDISLLELTAKTIRELESPVSTWGWVKFSVGVASVLSEGPYAPILPDRQVSLLRLTSSRDPFVPDRRVSPLRVTIEGPSRQRFIEQGEASGARD